MGYIGNSPALNESVDTAQLASPLTLAGNLTLGSDADGTDRLLSFGHSTLKSVIGIDDDQDVFAINTDNAFEAANDIEIDASGSVTMPKQPAFHVHPTSAQSSIATGGVTIVYGTERFDVGSNFASNTFTAPIGGKYFLQVSIQLRNVDTASAYYVTSLITSNKTYEFTFDPGMSEGEGDWNAWNWEFSTIADMDASDTAYVTLNQETGTAQSDINVAGTWFSGCLVC